jgi:predicted lipid-binding transport protein (Tim44 family)
MQMDAKEWIDQAADQLARLTPDFQGQVLRQQAALALIQAARDGAELEQLERLLQASLLQQLQQALKEQQS